MYPGKGTYRVISLEDIHVTVSSLGGKYQYFRPNENVTPRAPFKGCNKGVTEFPLTYSRGQKIFMFRLRRTVEKRSVPFLLYGQPFLFVQSENGYKYGKSTVAKRKRNGRFWLNECPFVSPRAAAVSF